MIKYLVIMNVSYKLMLRTRLKKSYN